MPAVHFHVGKIIVCSSNDFELHHILSSYKAYRKPPRAMMRENRPLPLTRNLGPSTPCLPFLVYEVGVQADHLKGPFLLRSLSVSSIAQDKLWARALQRL